jgi:hypothetical protein
MAADVGVAEGLALRKEDETEQAEDGRCAWEADEVGGSAAMGSLFFAGVQKHDDEDEEDHDGAGVDDDLRGGEELGTEGPVEDSERHHHNDQRESAVDGVTLQEQVEGSCYGQRAKDDKECQLHDVPLGPFVNRLRRLKQGRGRIPASYGYLLIVKQLAAVLRDI